MFRARIIRETLFIAAIGFAVELCIVLLLGFGSRPDLISHVALSAVGLFGAAGLLGALTANFLRPQSRLPSALPFVGIGVAILSLFSQALLGASLEFIRNIDKSYAFEAYLFKPVFAVLLIGSIPAIFFGLVYAWKLRKVFAAVHE